MGIITESESVSHSVMSDSVTPRTVACQAPLSLGFSKQECWIGLLFSSPLHTCSSGTFPFSHQEVGFNPLPIIWADL